jgi:hypothetical protein
LTGKSTRLQRDDLVTRVNQFPSWYVHLKKKKPTISGGSGGKVPSGVAIFSPKKIKVIPFMSFSCSIGSCVAFFVVKKLILNVEKGLKQNLISQQGKPLLINFPTERYGVGVFGNERTGTTKERRKILKPRTALVISNLDLKKKASKIFMCIRVLFTWSDSRKCSVLVGFFFSVSYNEMGFF